MSKSHLPVLVLIGCLLASIAIACTPGAAAMTATSVPPPTVSAALVPTTEPTTTPLPETSPTSVSSDSIPFTATGSFFALSVADAEASAKWYSDKLGLRIVMQPPAANKSRVIVMEGGGLIVELLQNDDAVPLSKAAPAIQDKMLVHGIVKVGVIVDDFDQTIATLRARGVKIVIGPFPKTTAQRANVIIEDNEGNLIQFFGK